MTVRTKDFATIALVVVTFVATLVSSQLPPGTEALLPPLIVHRVEPARLSVAGGIPLTIFGDNFPVNSTAATGLRVTVAGIECPIDVLQSSFTRLVCSRSPPGVLAAVDAGPKPKEADEQRVFTVPLVVTHELARAQFVLTFDLNITPVLTRVTGSISNGAELRVDTDIFTRNIAEVSISLAPHAPCDLGAVYGIAGQSVPAGATTWRCRLDRVLPGMYNVTAAPLVARGMAMQLGAAVPDRHTTHKVFQLGDDGRPFTTQVFPRVTGVSPVTASAVGGHLLTISGVGFVPNITQNRVTIGDRVCVVERARMSELQCRVPSGIPTNATVGGTGLVQRIFTGITTATVVTLEAFQSSEAVTSGTAASTTVVAEELEKENFHGLVDPIGVTLTGLFVPTHTGLYTFFCSASDFVQLRIAQTPGAPAVFACEAELSSAQRGREYFQRPRAISSPISLIAGQAYPIYVAYGAGMPSSWYRVAMAHTPPTGPNAPPAQHWSTVAHTHVINPDISFSGDFRTQSFTLEYNGTQLRVPGVLRNQQCSSLSIAAIINNQYPALHAIETVVETSTCSFFVTLLAPVGASQISFTGATVATVVPGSTNWYYNRVPARLLMLTPTSTATAFSVRVTSGGVVAIDSTPTPISYTEPVPLITSMEPYNVRENDRLTIRGLNLDVATATITFGRSPRTFACLQVETFIDGRSISCRIPSTLPGGVHLMSVELGTRGTLRTLDAISGGVNVTELYVKMDYTLTLVNPESGSMWGGTLLTISGRKIPVNMPGTVLDVAFGRARCDILSVTATRIMCRTSPLVPRTNSTPASWIASEVSGVSIKWNMQAIRLNISNLPSSLSFLSSLPPDAAASVGFTYNFGGLPEIHSISPTTGASSLPTTFTVTGNNLRGTTLQLCAAGSCVPCRTSVPLDNANGTCTVGMLPPGVYDFLAFSSALRSNGFSRPNITFISYFDVTDLRPTVGSLLGGSSLTLTGIGFHPSMRVMVGPTPCVLDEATLTTTSAVCVTTAYPVPGAFKVVVDTLNGPVADCLDSVCTFMRNSTTANPRLTAVVPRRGQMEKVTLTGVNFPLNPRVSITVGPAPCVVETIERAESTGDTRVTCRITAFMVAGPHPIVVNLHPFGIVGADRPELTRFDAVIAVTDAVPLRGSCAGGQLVTIRGVGFGPQAVVSIGAEHICSVGPLFMNTSVNTTHIVCETAKRVLRETAIEPITVTVRGTAASCCNYVYDKDALYTPLIRAVNPLTADPGRNITVDGQLVEENPLVGLFILNRPLPLLERNFLRGELIFGVPEMAAFRASGPVRFQYGNGWVNRLQKFVLYPGIRKVTGLNSGISLMSLGGGEIVTIEGQFLTDATRSNNLRVTVCGLPCAVTNATATKIECLSPALVNRDSTVVYDVASRPQFLNATAFVETVTPTSAFLTDEDTATVYIATRSASTDFFFGIDIGPQVFAFLQRLWFLPEPGFESRLENSFIQISADSIAWTTVIGIRGVTPGWNSVLFNPTAHHARFVRFLLDSSVTQVRVAEMSVEGLIGGNSGSSCLVVAHMQSEGSDPMTTCDERPLLCSELDVSMRLDFSAGEYTPTISRIFPRSGPSTGGTQITIVGRAFNVPIFDKTRRRISVSIDGVPCAVVANSTTEIQCVTGPRLRDSPTYMRTSVWVPGKGFAVFSSPSLAPFLYEDAWSTITSWEESVVPVEGAIVVIPPGVTMVLDLSPPPMTALIIQGGLLVSQNIDIEIIATYVIVDGGWLRVGASDVAYTATFIITLTGDRLTPELPRIGSKVLAVDGGRLEFYGQVSTTPQTTLAVMAQRGDRQIVLTGTTGWVTGDVVVITTTTNSYEQSETRTLTTTNDARIFLLDRPLEFAHFAATEFRAAGTTNFDIDFTARVVLLSRNIKIRGDTSSDDTRFGCHVMINSNGRPSFVSMNGVEIANCGQENLPQRHPLQFLDEVNGVTSRLRRVSVYRSYNRGIVIDNSNRVTIDECVVHDTIGHGIAIAGGSSRSNVLRDNLVYLSKPGQGANAIAANYHITHPQNWFERNLAGGAAHAGFWLNFEDRPQRPGIVGICPSQGQLQFFYAQTAHSNAMHGLWVYPRHYARALECGSDDFVVNPVVTTTITIMHAYLNLQQGINLHSVANYVITSGRVPAVSQLVPCKLFDNGDAGVGIKEIATGSVVLNGLFFLAHSATFNRFLFQAFRPTVGVFGLRAPGSDGLRLSNVTFEGYGDGFVDASSRDIRHFAVMTCADCALPGSQEMGGFTTHINDATWYGSPNRILIGAPFRDTVVDIDGSTINRRDPTLPSRNFTILPEFGHIALLPSCGVPSTDDRLTLRIDDDTIAPPPMRVIYCNGSYSFHRVVIFGLQPPAIDFAVSTSSPYGTQRWTRLVSTSRPWSSGFTTIIPTGTVVWGNAEVELNFLNMTTSITGTADWSSLGLSLSDALPLRTPYFDFNLRYSGVYVRMDIFARRESRTPGALGTSTLQPLSGLFTVIPTFYSAPRDVNVTGNPSHAFLDTEQKRLTARFTPVRAADQSRTILDVNALRCSSRGCIFMRPPMIPSVRFSWGDRRAWASGEVPGDGADVVIPPGMTIVLSSNTSNLRSLIIQGTLEMHPRLDAHIIANFVVVYGGRLSAGAVGSPHTPLLRISLIHDPEVAPLGIDDSIVVPSGTLLSCGQLSLVGQTRTPWSPVGAVSEAGKSEIKTTDTIDWQPGDHVAISSSSYSMGEMEEVIVASRFSDSRGFFTRSNLQYEHISYTVDVTDEEKLDINAKVALLSRTILIEGATPTGAPSKGCLVMFTEYGFDQSFASQGALRNAEIRYCAFPEQGHPAVLFHNIRRNAMDFQGNAIHHSLGTALRLSASTNIDIVNNVFYVSYGSTVDLGDSSMNTLTDNLAFGTQFPAWMAAAENNTKPYALCTYDSRFSVNTWINNVAAGSASEGFCVQPPHCDDDETTMNGNEAHSNIVGWFSAHVTPHPKTGIVPTCVKITGLHTWHNSYLGTYSAINADTHVSRSRSHDNHISYYLSREGSGNVTLSSSVVGGRATVFDVKACEYFRCVANPFDGSCEERAELYVDATRTFLFGEIGIVLPTFLEHTKHANYSRSRRDLPLVNARNFDKPVTDAAMYLSNVIFYSFQFGRDFGKCSGSTAISTNGITLLPVAPLHIVNATSRNTVEESKLYIHDPSEKWFNNPQMCDKQLCDALHHVLVNDVDGSYMQEDIAGAVTQREPGAYVSNYVFGALKGCSYNKGWNVYECPYASYGELLIESLDTDASERLIEPFELQDQDFLARINTHAQPPDCLTLDCEGQRESFTRPGRFNSVMQTENTYLADFSAEEPRRTRWYFRNCLDPGVNAPPRAVIMRVLLPSPVMDLSVWVVGRDEPVPITLTQIRYSDAPGTNYFENTDDRLYVLLPCESVVEVHQIVTATMGLKLDMPIEDFVFNYQSEFEPRVAAFLGILASRVRVVEVYPGSTIVAFRIIATDSFDYNSTQEAMEVNSLVMQLVSAGISRLAVELGLPVVDIEFIEWAVGTPASQNPSDISIGLSDDILTVIIVLSIVGFASLCFVQWRIYKQILKYKDLDEQLAKEQQVEFPDIQHPGFDIDLDDEEGGRPRVEIGLRSLKIKVEDDEAAAQADVFGQLVDDDEDDDNGGGNGRGGGMGQPFRGGPFGGPFGGGGGGGGVNANNKMNNNGRPPAFGNAPGWASDSIQHSDSMEYD